MRLRHVRPRHRAALGIGASLPHSGCSPPCAEATTAGAAGAPRPPVEVPARRPGRSRNDSRGRDADAGREARIPHQADTGSPWEPSKALFAISGHTVIRSVYDSLALTPREARESGSREEELEARKQRVETGEVKVRKEVHTEHKTMDVPVQREEVVVERQARRVGPPPRLTSRPARRSASR